jgi:4-hydroxy-tetrahydrodipicolinate synthase
MIAATDRLRGSIPPLITPLRDGEVDYATYAKLCEAQVAGGSHGVIVNGTTGEPSTLTIAERNRLVDVAVATIAGRIPVVAATGSQSLAETRDLTRHAVGAGVDALLIVTPYYIRPPQRGLIEYYLALAREHDTPWMVYHIPGRAAVEVTLDTLREIRQQSPHFVGMKHAAQDLALVSSCLNEFGAEFRIFAGLEELSFPMMALGACGTMNAMGNLIPARIAQLCEAVADGELREAASMHAALLELNRAVFFDTNPIPLKYMMKRLGIIERNEHRLPMAPATPELAARLDAVLERAGLPA